jgi:membrane fusion protein
MKPLFRSEMQDFQAQSAYGEMLAPIAPKAWLWVTASVCVAIAVAAYLVFGEYTKRVTVSGVLLPHEGFVRILPPMAGVVTDCFVHEGQFVRKGTRLFVVTDERETTGDTRRLGAAVAEQIVERREQLQREREKTVLLAQESEEAARHKLIQLRSEAARADDELELYRLHVATEEVNLERYRKLAASHFLSDVGLSEKQEELADLRARVASTERMRAALTADIEAATSELRQIPLHTDVQVAQIDNSMNSLKQESIVNDEHDQVVVTASEDGTIAAVLAHSGETVQNQALATLVPTGARLDAELFVPSRWVGFVKPGQTVRLRYEAYPYQKFGQYLGEVDAVSNSQIDPGDVPVGVPHDPGDLEANAAKSHAGEGLYKISVRLADQNVMAYGVSQPLLSGMLVDASILQDQRRLIEWIFEPIVSLTGHVMN